MEAKDKGVYFIRNYLHDRASMTQSEDVTGEKTGCRECIGTSENIGADQLWVLEEGNLVFIWC